MRARPAPPHPRSAAGLTLVELIVAIVVVGIAIAAVLGGLSAFAARSAESMIRGEAVSIGAAYLEEILSKSFTANPVEASRCNYDDVSDYDGIRDSGVRDQCGSPVAQPGFAEFTIAVSVAPVAMGSVPAGEAKQIDVTVTHPSGVTVRVSAYRTLYP